MTRERMTLTARIPVAVLFLLTIGVPSVFADIVTFTLGIGNSAISKYTAPYATVSVDLTSSTTATITVTSLTHSGDIYLFGSTGAVAVDVNAAKWTLGTITGSNAGTGFTAGPWGSGGSGNEDGFGSFNQIINSVDAYKRSSDTISFGLTDKGGTWASAANVLKANANGYEVAAHIFVTQNPANAVKHSTALATGYAGGKVPDPVPDGGASLMLLGGVLVSIETLRRKFRRV